MPPVRHHARTFIWLALCLSLGCDGQRPPSTAAHAASSFDQMLAQLDEAAGQFEDQRDVKCWTSFKRLETFVAGCQLAPATTHIKTEVVIDLVDQVWRAAAQVQVGGQAITAANFDAASQEYFRWRCDGSLHCRLEFGERELSVPSMDFDNYRGTVEPIRIVQTLARRLERRDPSRLPLDASAVPSATRLAAVLSTALLKEANVVGQLRLMA